MPDVLLLLSQIAGILVAARLVGRAVAVIGQPRVVGEMRAGLRVGPARHGRHRGIVPRSGRARAASVAGCVRGEPG